MRRNWSGVWVLAGGASYGFLATFVKFGYAAGYSLGEMAGSQMFVGAAILWILALANPAARERIDMKTTGKLMLAGTLSGLTGLLYYGSMKTIPASIAIVLLFQFAWVGVLYEWLFSKKRPHRNTYVSLLLVFVGTILAAGIGSGELGNLSVAGLLLGFLSAFTFAGFIYASGHVATGVSPWLRSPLLITGSCLAVFLVFPPTFLVSGVLWEGLWRTTLVIALLGGVVPAAGFTLGAPHLSGGVANILSSSELPVAVMMAAWVLKEPVRALQWVGVLLILAAIAIGQLHAARRPAPADGGEPGRDDGPVQAPGE